MSKAGAIGAALVVRLRFVIVLAWLLGVAWTIQQPAGELHRGGASLRDLAPVELPAIQTELRAAESFPIPLHSRTIAVQHRAQGLDETMQRRLVTRAAPGEVPDPRWPALLGGIPVVNQPPIAGARGTAGTTALTYLVFAPETSATQRTRQGKRFANSIPDDAGSTALTGAVPARISTADLLLDALPRLEVVTAVLVALAVAVFYRTLLAPLIVLLAVGISFVMSRYVITAIATEFDQSVPREVEPLLVALLLGVVTDYTLFFLSATRRELRAGSPRLVAARVATRETTPIVAVAALTVSGGCAALLVARTEFLATFGPALGVTVVISALVVLTLVPALLAIFGSWSVLARSERRRAGTDAKHTSIGRDERHTLPRTPISARWIRYRLLAVPILIVAGAGLVAVTAQASTLRLGYDAISGLPADDPVARGQALVADGFAPGIVAPTVLLIEGEDLDEKLVELVRLQDRIGRQPGVAGTFGVGTVRDIEILDDVETTAGALRDPLGLAVTRDGTAARMLLVFDGDPYGGRVVDQLGALRDSLPAIMRGAGLPDSTVGVAGDTAVVLELVEDLEADMLRVALAVIAFDLLLLMAFLRSLLAPILVVGGSVLAVGASLGITTFVFQDLLGGDGIAFYVPLATLVLLLSLGADYGVFSIGSAWQLARDRPLKDALIESTVRTNGTIALAGLVLALSFGLLAIVPIDAFRQFAVAMSTGVLIDTFVIRPILLPALIRAFGSVSMWPTRAGARTRAPLDEP